VTVHAKTTITGSVSLNKEFMYMKDKQYTTTHYIIPHSRTNIVQKPQSIKRKQIQVLHIIYNLSQYSWSQQNGYLSSTFQECTLITVLEVTCHELNHRS